MSPPVTLSADEYYTDIPVGEILRRARMQHGISIADAETHLHIRAQHLMALEQSDFDALPGQVYVVGFIRTYAEFLGLDGSRVIHVLKRQTRGLGTPQSLNAHILPTDSRLPNVSVLAAAAALFLLVLVIWIAYQNAHIGSVYTLPAVPDDVQGLETLENLTRVSGGVADLDKKRMAAAKSVAKSVSETIKTVVTQVEGQEATSALPPIDGDPMTTHSVATVSSGEPNIPATSVVITLMDDSWIELRDPNGRVVDARLYKTGETFRLDTPLDASKRAYTMTVNNAAAIHIRVGEKTLSALGSAGQVRRNVSLDPKTLLVLMNNP